MLNKQKLIDALEDLWDVIDHQEHDPMQANGVNRAITLVDSFPDDNPWITTPPKSSEWGKVYMTVMPYNAPIVIRGSIEGGKFHFVNGRRVKERVTAWKYIRYPEPYKEVSEE